MKSVLGQARTLFRASADAPAFLERYEAVLGSNQFLTVFDILEYRYTRHSRVREVLGYSPQEFTGHALIGNGASAGIMHPDDVPYYLHFGGLMHEVAAEVPGPVELLRDYAWFRFRVRAKDGALYAAHYLSFYFELHSANAPRSHVDVWSVVPIDPSARFEPDFGFFSAHEFARAKAAFHRLNEAALGFRLTPQQARVLQLLRSGLSRKEVAGELGIAEGSVDSHFTTIRVKANHFLERCGVRGHVSTAIQLIALAERYKLFRDDPFR